MRRGFTFTEMVVVIIILPFVLFLLDGLFGTLLTEIPRSCRMAQQGSMLLGLLEQIHHDVGEAKGLPAEFAGRTADDKLLLVELPEGVIGYQIEKGRVTRSIVGAGSSARPGQPHGVVPTSDDPERKRTWAVPDGRIEWQVWQKDGQRYAVEVKTHVELEIQGRLEKKMARAHLFYGGVLK